MGGAGANAIDGGTWRDQVPLFGRFETDGLARLSRAVQSTLQGWLMRNRNFQGPNCASGKALAALRTSVRMQERPSSGSTEKAPCSTALTLVGARGAMVFDA